MKEKTKIEALGVVGQEEKLKADFSHQVSLEKLREPLAEGAGLMMFCRGCGSYHQIKKDSLQELEGVLGRKIPASDFYYETSSCLLCDSTEHEAEIKPIL